MVLGLILNNMATKNWVRLLHGELWPLDSATGCSNNLMECLKKLQTNDVLKQILRTMPLLTIVIVKFLVDWLGIG